MTSNRETLQQYLRALTDHDLDAAEALLHDDFESRWPQSGELIRGRANARAMLEDWPGGDPTPAIGHIVGQEEQFVVGPSWNIVHLVGSGDEVVSMGTITYPNGETWHAIGGHTFRDGKIWRQVEYFAEPFDPPEWRRPYVEVADA